jgi:hypothetical protein
MMGWRDGRPRHDEAERARFGAYALYLRAAQAATLRAHLEQLLDDNGRTMGVVVAGDLNDSLECRRASAGPRPARGQGGRCGRRWRSR